MNRRTPVAFVLLIAAVAAAAHAQDKATPSKSKSEDKQPKVLTFQPDAATPAAAKAAAAAPFTKIDPLLDGPAQMVDAFFTTLKDGKIDDAYGALTKGSKIAEKPQELSQLKAKTKEAIEVFGNIVGYDFVESHAVGTRLVRATYISQGAVFPLRWRFYFYKPQATWRLIDMRVDDKLTGLFDEPTEAKPPEPKPDDSDSPLK